MDAFLQFLIAGLMIGSLYGLVGIGFTAVYNATGVVNFAQGDFAMLGAMIAIAAYEMGLPLVLAIVVAVLLLGVIGAILERTTIRPVRGHVIRGIIVTIGLSVTLQGAAIIAWGTDAQPMPSFSGDTPLHIGGATILPQTFWVIGTAVVLMAVLYVFLQYTLLGKAFRACAVNGFAARLVGIRIENMRIASFMISGMFGAVGGIIIAPIARTQYDSGLSLGIKGFVACIIGGFGNPIGAAVGGLLLGLLEAFASGYISSGMKSAIAFLLLLVFLLVRPGGLLGELEKAGRH